MSTENEGPAVTPAAGPTPTQGAAASGPPADSTTSEDSGDFALARPGRPGTEPGGDAHQAVSAAFDEPAAAPPGPRHTPGPEPAAAEQTTRFQRIRPADDAPAGAAASSPGGAVPASVPASDGTAHLPPVPTGHPQPGPAPASTPSVLASESHGGGTPPPPTGGYGGGPPGPAGPGDPGSPGAGHGGPHNPWGAPPVQPPPSPGGRRRSGGLIAAVLAAALVAGGVGGGVGFWAADRNGGSGSTTISTEGDSQALNRSPDSVAGIAAKALPSVVTIETSGSGEAGTGTGFVFDQEGHILTNNHVVASSADGGKLTATFSDGKEYGAEVVGRAEGYDIAVIKLTSAGDRELKPLPLGDSEKMKVGDATIAIGAPFGLSGTVTTGIVSAKNRPVASSDGQGSDASYMNALQTDASINPGNSGGPLLDAQGAVIGVNSAIQSGGGGGLGGGQSGSVGLGFAIPVNQAKRVATQLIETGVPVYPVIGVRVQSDKQGNGAAIAERVSDGDPVTPGGPADKAGLEPGDVITEFDGTKIDSSPTLIASIWAHEPGQTVELTYERDGQAHTTEVTLGSRKGDD